MYQQFIFDVINAVVAIVTAVFASGFITAAITQVFKLKWVAIPAKKYPTVTALVVSILVSLAAVYMTGLIQLEAGWFAYVVFVVATLATATKTYDIVKAIVLQIRGIEDTESSPKL